MKKNILFLILFSAFLVQGTFAQKSKASKKLVLSGFVKDMDDQPLKDAIIVVPNSTHTKKTNKKGFYKIKVEPSTEKILALTSLNGYLEKKINGKKNLDFVLQINADQNSAEYHDLRSKELIRLGYDEDVVFENSTDAVTFNGRKVNPHKYTSFEEMLDKEMRSPDYVVSRHGLYIVDGKFIRGIWNLKNIKPMDVKSIKVEHIGLHANFYGIQGIFGVCIVKTKSSADD